MAGFGTFFGLNIGVNALQTAQQAMSVIGNNIANASTPGYTEETANITEATPFPSIPSSEAPAVAGQVGQGSLVESVDRQISPYYNKMVRDNLSNYNGQNTYLDNLNQIQSIIGEPTSTSIHSAIDNFFSAWQTVSTQPDNAAARQTVIGQAQTLANTFSTVQNQLTAVVDNLDSNINDPNSGQVAQVNSYASQINQLNGQIKIITQVGQNPNQLLDQRDTILNNLAQLGNLSYTENKDGTVDVTFGQVQIVNSSTGTTTSFAASDAQNLTSGSIWANEQGIQEAQSVISQLNTLQSAIVTSVNNQLQQGYQYNSSTPGGNPPFLNLSTTTHISPSGNTTTSVVTMSVTQGFTPDQLAVASTPNAPGDGSNASTIAGFQNSTTLTEADGTTQLGSTPDDYYTSLVSSIGAKTSGVQSAQQTANSLLQQAQTLQQSVSGVNQNEEIAKMIDFQNMYQAASKFISIQDQMLQTLIQEV